MVLTDNVGRGDRFEAFSGGAQAGKLNPTAGDVMREVGIDISGHHSKDVAEFLGRSFHWERTFRCAQGPTDLQDRSDLVLRRRLNFTFVAGLPCGWLVDPTQTIGPGGTVRIALRHNDPSVTGAPCGCLIEPSWTIGPRDTVRKAEGYNDSEVAV